MSWKKSFLVSLVSLVGFSANSACIREWKANLRSGPGANYKKSWVVGKYMPLLELGRKGSWIKVQDVDKQIHWAYAPLLTRSIACVVVKAPFSYLRTGPGTKYPKAFPEIVDKYVPFKKLEEKKGWLHVEDARGKKYWVFKKNMWEAIRVQAISF